MAEEIVFKIIGKDSSKAAFKGLSSSLKGLIGVGLKASAVITAKGGAIFLLTKKIAEADDRVAKFSSRIGVATSELSQYQFVAGQSGIATEQFNMATQRMTRRVSEAAKNTGEAVGALRELNIDAKTFQNLPLGEKMNVLSDRMGELTSDSDRLRLAFKLFDSEGTAMVQMLGQGSEAMRAAAADAKFLGLVVDDEAAAKAELFTDSLGRMSGSFKGVSRGIAGELMPLFSGLADRIANSMARNRENIVSFVKQGITSFFTLVEVVKQAFSNISKVLSDPKAFQRFLENVLSLVPKVGAAAIAMGKFLAMGIFEGIKLAQSLFIGFGEWIGETLAQIVLGEKVTSITEKFSQVFVTAIQKAKEGMALELEELRAVVGVIMPEIGKDIADTFGVNLEAAREAAKSTIESLSLFAETTRSEIEETGAVVSEFMLLLDDQKKIFMEELRNSNIEFLETMRETASATIDGISQSFASAIVDGESLAKSLRAITKSVLKEVIAALIKMGVQRLLLSSINVAASKADATASASRAVGLAGANMFASWAGAPWPISLGAPAAAAAAIAGAASSFASGAAAGAGVASVVAHGGLTSNPQEQTARIIQGERIVSPRQNRDLTTFLESENTGSTTIENLNITLFPNATNADAVFDMDPQELRDLLTDPIIDALNSASRDGILPTFAERNE